MQNLSIFYTPPEITTSDFYFSEIIKFNKIASNSYEEFYRKEKMHNQIYSILILVLVIFSTAIIIQYLTFADLSSLLFCSFDKISIINTTSSIIALLFLLSLFIIHYLFVFFLGGFSIFSQNFIYYIDGLFSSIDVAYIELIKCILIPIIIYLLFSKVIFWTVFYSQYIEIRDENDENVLFVKNFIYNKLFSNIKSVVLKDGALAYIYLLRIYSLIYSVIISMVLFLLINHHLFFFTDNSLRALLIYNTEQKHSDSLKLYIQIQLVNIVFLIMQLLYFFNYPKFSKTKQVFDYIFTLYDMKIMNSLGIERTCEKDVLESNFIVEFLNFDSQSEKFYYSENGIEFYRSNLSEVKLRLLIFLIFNSEQFYKT